MDLVTIRGNDAVCDSVQVAERFGKRHDVILRAIDNLLKNVEIKGRKMFCQSNYQDSRGRRYRMYLMNRKGFSILVMGFNGEEAVHWKLMYSDAFDRMEVFIRDKAGPPWVESRKAGKLVRKAESDAIKRLVEYAKGQGSQHAERYYSIFSKLADKTAGVEDREQATAEQLWRLAVVEEVIRRCINEGIARQEPYKAIYQACKLRLEQFSKMKFVEN